MKYIMIISWSVAMVLLGNIERGNIGAWGSWCLFGITLWWTSLIIRAKVYERRGE